MAVILNANVEGAEQGELQSLIEAATELYPTDLKRALALPSVRDDVEGRPSRRDLYDAVDVDALAELAEAERVAGYDVRGDEHVGYFVTFAVIDSDSTVSRGFFPYDAVPTKADAEDAPAGDEQALEGRGSGEAPADEPFKGYDAANQDAVLAYLADENRTDDEIAAVKAYEAQRKNRAGIAGFERGAS